MRAQELGEIFSATKEMSSQLSNFQREYDSELAVWSDWWHTTDFSQSVQQSLQAQNEIFRRLQAAYDTQRRFEAAAAEQTANMAAYIEDYKTQNETLRAQLQYSYGMSQAM